MCNKKSVFWFLGLTFGLTWLLDLLIYLHGDYTAPLVSFLVQLSSLMPAFSGILLGLFAFPKSPIYYRSHTGRGRWFYYFFLALTVIFAIGILALWLFPAQESILMVVGTLPMVFGLLGLLLLVVLRSIAGREGMTRVWLNWGNWRYWLWFGLGFVAFYILQVVLNALVGMGPSKMEIANPAPGLDPGANLILLVVMVVVVGSVVGIVIGFGEEYGWRGYLQNELFKLGRVRGVLLLGVIWGIWHWPVILMGHNYPDHPLLGVVLMTLYTMGSGVVLGYAVLKSGSVLLAAFLHAINNQVANFLFIQLGFTSYDSVYSFGLGIYGIAMITIIALIILRDPIWRIKGSNLPSPEQAPVETA